MTQEIGVRGYMVQRQIDVQRKNLIFACRFTTKTLIDKASLGNIDDNCEELINFCAVLEQVLSFRLRATRTWYGSGEPRAFWDYIRQSCNKVQNNCIKSIDTLENIKSQVSKGRAWIRCALMEKRLSEYISTALQQTNITRQSYLDGAVMLSEEMSALCGELLGLNAIDFSFCLKGESLDFPCPVQIDYTPYLNFKQSPESVQSDHVELTHLDGSVKSDLVEEEINLGDPWEEKFKALEAKYKLANEQKGYLEELVRRRENQIQETNKQRVTALNTLRQWQVDSKQERLQLESVILELQHQLAETKTQKEFFENKYQSFLDRIQGGQVAMEEVTWTTSLSASKEKQSSGEGMSLSSRSYLPLGPTRKQLQSKEDTSSLKAMAGSFTSQSSGMSASMIVPENDSVTNQNKFTIQKKTSHGPVSNVIPKEGEFVIANQNSGANSNVEEGIDVRSIDGITLTNQNQDHIIMTSQNQEEKSEESKAMDSVAGKTTCHVAAVDQSNTMESSLNTVQDEKQSIKTQSEENQKEKVDLGHKTIEEKLSSDGSEENGFVVLPKHQEDDSLTLSSYDDPSVTSDNVKVISDDSSSSMVDCDSPQEDIVDANA